MWSRASWPSTVPSTWPRTSAQSHGLSPPISTVTRGSRRTFLARWRCGSVLTSRWSSSQSIQVNRAWGVPSGMRVTTVARFLPLQRRATSGSRAMGAMLSHPLRILGAMTVLDADRLHERIAMGHAELCAAHSALLHDIAEHDRVGAWRGYGARSEEDYLARWLDVDWRTARAW